MMRPQPFSDSIARINVIHQNINRNSRIQQTQVGLIDLKKKLRNQRNHVLHNHVQRVKTGVKGRDVALNSVNNMEQLNNEYLMTLK